MTEDALLQGFLLDAAAAEFASELTDTTPVAVSPRLLRQMNAMLNDPNSWAKRQHRSIWSRIARTAAVILLVLSLSLGALMAVSPTVRAAVKNWIIETYEHSVVYRFFDKQADDPLAPLPRYEITALPEGYELYQEIDAVGSYGVRFINENGDYLWFEYQRMTQGAATGISTEDMIVSEVDINGKPGQLFHSLDDDVSSAVVWIDENSNLKFMLDGFFSDLDLLHIAESVSLDDNPPAVLPEYEVTWIPEGFVLEERVELDDWVLCTYHNSVEDEGFSFDYCFASSDMQLQIGGYDNEAAPTAEYCFVNGIAADYYPAGNSETSNLIWIDEKQGIVFAIEGTLEKEVILHIAESVSLSDTAK